MNEHDFKITEHYRFRVSRVKSELSFSLLVAGVWHWLGCASYDYGRDSIVDYTGTSDDFTEEMLSNTLSAIRAGEL